MIGNHRREGIQNSSTLVKLEIPNESVERFQRLLIYKKNPQIYWSNVLTGNHQKKEVQNALILERLDTSKATVEAPQRMMYKQ